MPDASSSALLAEFGTAVRRLRMARGYSQEAFADLAGMHRTYLGDVERGSRNVSLVNINRIAVALSIDLASLMAEVEHGRKT